MKPASPTTQPAQSPDAKAGHTSGPWEIRGSGHNRADIWQAESAGNEQIGEVYTGGANKNNPGHANARLIAAAPAYYAAAEQIIAAWRGAHWDENKLGHKRIIKADVEKLFPAIAALAAAHAAAKGKL